MATQLSPAKLKRRAQISVAAALLLFLMVNAAVLTLATKAFWQGDVLPMLLAEDSSVALRMLVFLVGAAVAWLLAGSLYRLMMHAWEPVEESTNVAMVLFGYMTLLFAAAAFLGALGWAWLPAIFLVLILGTVLTIPSLLGPVITWGALGVTAAICAVVWYVAI